jgi:hypothetical protein
MEVSGDEESTRISLDIRPLFFNIIYKFVQELVITYYEKCLLHLGFECRRMEIASLRDVQFAIYVKVQGGRDGAMWWWGVGGPENASGAGCLLLSPEL